MNNYSRIAQAIEFIDSNFKNQPELAEIAAHLNLSPFHFQRLFTEWAGISPKKFLQFLTVEYTKDVLRQSQSTLETTYEAGLSSTSRLHELFINIEAMTPAEYKSQGQGLQIYYGFHNSIFGRCLIGVTQKGICGLYFIDDTNEDAVLAEFKSQWALAEFIESNAKTEIYLQQIFDHQRTQPLNILLKGTNFQVQVWKALLAIPEGKLATYADIATQINNPKAVRAVGTAIGLNKVGFLIPCHRVINQLGVVGNYRWGKVRKKIMLGWEAMGSNYASPVIPTNAEN